MLSVFAGLPRPESITIYYQYKIQAKLGFCSFQLQQQMACQLLDDSTRRVLLSVEGFGTCKHH